MHRRRILHLLGGLSISTTAGCTATDGGPSLGDTPPSDSPAMDATGSPAELQDGTATEPSCSEAVYAIVQSSGTDVKSLLAGAAIEASLVDENENDHYVVREATLSEVEGQLRGAEVGLRFAGTVEWCSQPVCDAQTFLLLRSDAPVEQVRTDFPEDVSILRGEAATDEIRIVYSPSAGLETLTERATQADYETATAVGGTFTSCEARTPAPD